MHPCFRTWLREIAGVAGKYTEVTHLTPPRLRGHGVLQVRFGSMKAPYALLAALLVSTAAASAPDLSQGFFLNANTVILFLGDSITANGGYIKDLQAALAKKFPGMQAKFVNAGISGEAMPGLLRRVDSVLKVNKPSLVFSSYGMNDGGYNPLSAAKLQSYKDGMVTLQAAVAKAGAPLILMTPTAFDSLTAVPLIVTAPPYSFKKFYANYDSVLTAYGNTVMAFQGPAQVTLDIQNPLRVWAKSKRKTAPTFAWTAEGVHPTPEGHQLMADAIFAALFPPVTGLARAPRQIRQVSPRVRGNYRVNGARAGRP